MSFNYDPDRNFLTQVTEPNRGSIIRSYNGFGEVVAESTALDVVGFAYDKLGKNRRPQLV